MAIDSPMRRTCRRRVSGGARPGGGAVPGLPLSAVKARPPSPGSRALGAGPLCHDEAHSRAVADLTVYLRQHHAERDLAQLGALVAERGTTW